MIDKPIITLNSCSIRESNKYDAYLLAPVLRDADKAEVIKVTGRKPLESLIKGYKLGLECYTVVDLEGNPICMYGVAGADDDKGVAVWALASETLVTTCKLDFLSQSKLWIPKILKKYKHLYNFVDVRNKVHLKWLQHMGFTFGEVYDIGKHGEPFQHFYMKL